MDEEQWTQEEAAVNEAGEDLAAALVAVPAVVRFISVQRLL
jgi:hypothetical protein